MLFYNWLTVRTIHKELCVSFLLKLNLILSVCYMYYLYLKLKFKIKGVDHGKIIWVDWHSICRSQEVGGLGVRRIKEFNFALLGKWCWRLLVDKDSL